VRACSSLDSVSALIDLLHRPSQRVRYAASGRGTLTHLAAELLANLAGCTLQPRFFSGSAPAMAEVLQGGADFMVASLHTALPHLRSGTLRALAVSSGADYSELAQVPSMRQAGLTELDIAQWYGLFAPPQTPHSIVEKFNAYLSAMLSRAEIVDQLRAEGATPIGGTPHELAQLLVAESRRWRQAIGTLRTPTLTESVD
jgi:tripartite-type tricarboxylate transporter receptor subunit TctC